MTTPISSASTSFSTPIDAGVRDIEAGTAPTAPPAVQAAQDQIREEEEEATRPLTIVAGSAQKTEEGGKEDSEDKEKDKDRDKVVPPVLGFAGGIDRAALLGDHDDEQGSLLEEDGPDEDPIVHATRDLCLGLLRKAFYVVMPLSIIASVFACLYGWIFVNTAHYLADPDSWQRCIVYNTGNAGATPQNFAVSASAFGGMMFIFMGLGFKAGYLALQDIELLPYSLTVTCYTLLGQMVYRPVNPVVPAITELTPTLVSLASFIHPKMYTNVPNPNNNNACQHAYRVNACFLAFCCILFAANIFNLFLQIYALVRTWRVPRQERYVLVWYRPALVLVLLAIGGYILTVGAKEDAALKTLFLLEEVGHGYLFPFERPALDTVGLFLLLTVASVIYGACKQEPGSFKWAAFTAYVNVLLSYPILISNFQAYHLYGFWTYEGCKHFLETDTSHAGGANRQLLFLVAGNKYPETEKAFCRDTRVALLGQFAQFVIMHLAIGACLLVVLANWRIEKPSMQLHLFGSKASSFLFPDAPPGQEDGEGGRGRGSSQHRGEGGGRRRVSSVASNNCTVLQEPLLSPSGAGGGTGLRPPLHHRRQSSGSVTSHRGGGHGRGRSSMNDHLLGPVLD
ncbi:hypothetical protein VYU27_003227 [Nannochloropsis oceanica]